MKHLTFLALLGAAMFFAIFPVALTAYNSLLLNPVVAIPVALNLAAWSLVATAIVARRDLTEVLQNLATRSGVNTKRRGLLKLFYAITHELERKNNALSIDLVENRIASREELSNALERIVGRAFKVLDAESAELALFDKESGAYHSSFVLGKPFSSNAQMLLAPTVEGERKKESDLEVMVQPICFAGTVLGQLRIALKRGRSPTTSDQELLTILALQGTLAIVNSRYNEELLKMRRSSDESVRAKTGFLANLSHEIRGPLGIMLNAVELVVDGLCGEVTSDQLDTLKMVRQNGQHLLELINDVLDYAKSESGKIVPEKVQIVVNDLLIDVCNVVRSQAQHKGHKLVCKPSDAALAVHCDRRHIRQMMINLLTNAVKYTPSGGTIEVWAERTPGNKIRISVKDSGVGIDRSQRHKVFGAFERVDNAYSIKQSGTGLGMPLTKRLAEVNGAGVDFDSQPGKGSHFWLVFPSVEYSAPHFEQSPEVMTAAKGRGERILVADGEEHERGMVAKYLQHIGFSTSQVANTDDAIKELHDGAFALLLVGNDLVDDANAQFFQKVRSIPGNASLPIILVSSRAFVFDVENYLKLGVDRCLSKPLELRDLGNSVREVIDSRDQANHNSNSGTKHSTTKSALKGQDILH